MISFAAAFESEEQRDKFIYFYEQFYQLFVKVANKITGSVEASEEIVHDVFAEVLERTEYFLSLDSVNFRNLCVKIIRNRSIDAYRRKKLLLGAIPLDSEEAPEIPSGDMPLEMQIIKQEDYDRLQSCIARLDPLNRQILEMKYVHEMTLEKISSELNMTLPQVNGRLARARTRVKALYEEGI
ncbi:MAG: sigma-70 family RNA polymerase sigma factor [Oscillospiraceae bacterium]|nr:sigma-70 family RNA polymerase sigma factor [Oscillospiraceae bacterium]